jgi:hypothetical protein
MSRILLPIGDTMPQNSTIAFTAYIARQMGVDVITVPLKILSKQKMEVSKATAAAAGIGRVGLHLAEVATRDGRYQQQIIGRCRSSFGDYNIQVSSESDHSISHAELIKETRYADLVIVEGGLSPESNAKDTNPTHYVKELLHNAECPVFIAPLSFQSVDEILFAFDGSQSSMIAIKQFARLFPDQCKKKLIILEVYEDHQSIEIKIMLTKWLACNMTDYEFVSLQGNADDRLLEYALAKHESIIIMGGYGRDAWSRLLHPSAAAAVVKIISSATFIAHK